MATPPTPNKDIHAYRHSNQTYWTNRSLSYSEQHRGELNGTQHAAWAKELDAELQKAFGGKPRGEVKVLDIGCGPGFFAIILAELGYQVTAVDYTESMLEQAKANAAALGQKAQFMRMDAESLEFESGSFDAVVSRNLTWNLPNPEGAYAEWTRVLRHGGLLLNYDANWYAYLFDDEMRKGYESDRANTAKAGCNDRYLHTDIDSMERLASKVPAGSLPRPAWDKHVLDQCGLTVSVDHRVSDRVWSVEELVNQASTPLFGIRGRKHPGKGAPQ